MTSPIVKAGDGWTAGPWSLGAAYPGSVFGSDGFVIARCDAHIVCRLPVEANANAARIVYAVNNIDAAEADRNTAQASNINAMHVIAARDKEIRGKDARIAGLEAALREIIATTAPHDARNEYESGAKDAFKFCADIATAALEGSKP